MNEELNPRTNQNRFSPEEFLLQEKNALEESEKIAREVRETKASGDLQSDINTVLTGAGLSQTTPTDEKNGNSISTKDTRMAVAREKSGTTKNARITGATIQKLETPPKTDSKESLEQVPLAQSVQRSTDIQNEHIESAELVTNKTAQITPQTSSIRTLRGDIAKSVTTKKTSLARIAIAEDRRAQEGKGRVPEKTPKQGGMKRIFVLFGALLILGGIGVLGTVAVLNITGSTITTSVPDTKIPIFVNEKYTASLPETRFGTLQALEETKNQASGLGLGHIAQVRLTGLGTTTPLTLDSFIARFSTNIPPALVRTLTDTYLLGIHSLGTDEFFLLIEVEDGDTAFSNMLKWEPGLSDDLSFLVRKSTQTIRTGTSTEPVLLNKNGFEDILIENRDIRALFDTNDDMRLGYSFPRPTLLLIANNTSSFVEIFGRLSGIHFQE
jgi:hypothetical protein